MTNTEDDEPLVPPADLPAATSATRATKILCANCGAELFGPHCYSCGQPIKGMVRQLSSIVADMADTVLNIDSRIFRTLWPLMVKPGFLTNEYLAGRRVRYVTPFRLYFFLSVIAFLVMQIGLDATLDLSKGPLTISDESSISSAQTADQVQVQRDAALAGLEQAKSAAASSARAQRGIQKAQDKIHAEADKRLEYLKQVDDAKAAGKPAPPDPQTQKDNDDFNFEIAGSKWDPKTSPIAIGWLPGFVNARLNVLATHMVDNLPRIKKNPKPLLLGAFSTLPQVLFVVMPLFALLLKIFYIFKRRLYMEHVMVALHSHSFIFLSLLLITLAGMLSGAVNASAPWLSALLGWVIFALGWWLPIYLLIMQKRVYRQGWFMTVIKYLTIGFCYTILVSFGLVAALLISLATT